MAGTSSPVEVDVSPASCPLARSAELVEQLLELGAVVRSAGRDAENRQFRNLKDSIHIAITRDTVWTPVRRIIKLHRDDWRKRRIANHKIDVLGANSPEVRLTQPVPFIGLNEISQSDFCQYRVAPYDATQNVVKGFLRFTEQISPAQKWSEGNVHSENEGRRRADVAQARMPSS